MSPKHSPLTDLPGPWSHRMLHVRGQRLHVAECGSSRDPLVLFIHGSTGGWFEWREVLPLLADAPLHTVAVSLRGYAPSDRTPTGYSPEVAADDVSGLIRALGHQSAVIVGQGYGAWVGWTLYARQPNTVRHLIGCGAAHPLAWAAQVKRPWSRGFYGSFARNARDSFNASVTSLPTRVRRRLRGRQETKDKTISYLVDAALADTAAGFAESTAGRETAQLMKASLSAGALYPALEHSGWWARPWPSTLVRWLAELKRAGLPESTLLLGDEDSKTPLTLVRQSLPEGCEPVMVERAGHYLPIEAPTAVADAVRIATGTQS